MKYAGVPAVSSKISHVSKCLSTHLDLTDKSSGPMDIGWASASCKRSDTETTVGVGGTIFPSPSSSVNDVFRPGAGDLRITPSSPPTLCPVRSNFLSDPGDEQGADTPAERGATDWGIIDVFGAACSTTEGRMGVWISGECGMINSGSGLEVCWCDNWGVSGDCDEWGACEAIGRCGGRDGGRTRVTEQRFVDDKSTASNGQTHTHRQTDTLLNMHTDRDRHTCWYTLCSKKTGTSSWFNGFSKFFH